MSFDFMERIMYLREGRGRGGREKETEGVWVCDDTRVVILWDASMRKVL
jgi:hypothetical protein